MADLDLDPIPDSICEACKGTGSVPCPEHGVPCFNECKVCGASGRVDAVLCLWGWGGADHYPGGCCCPRKYGHAGRCKCDCDRTSQRPKDWDTTGRRLANEEATRG